MIPAAASLRKRYGQLTMPVVIMAGDADKVVNPDRHARRLHAQIPNSELHLLKGIGHSVHYFAQDEIVSAVSPNGGLHSKARPELPMGASALVAA